MKIVEDNEYNRNLIKLNEAGEMRIKKQKMKPYIIFGIIFIILVFVYIVIYFTLK